MKTLKNTYLLVGLFCHVAFADYVCIYNKTDCDLSIEKVSTGCWIFEQQKLDVKGLRRFAKKLEDTESLGVTIPSKEGFLIRYQYADKEGSEKTSIVLSSPQKESFIDIDLTDEEEGITRQGIYQITQDYNGPSARNATKEERKWRHSCDKMIIISNENL